jgi:hypothetical protein
MADEVSYWSLVEPMWSTLNASWYESADEFLRQFRSVRPEAGHLYAAHWCQSEVCNGGLHQFFFNTTGLLAPEALKGFRAIGIGPLAQILKDAMGYFGEPYPRDRSVRNEMLPARSGSRKDWDPFYNLDTRFFESVDRWESAANAYAERSIEHDGG